MHAFFKTPRSRALGKSAQALTLALGTTAALFSSPSSMAEIIPLLKTPHSWDKGHIAYPQGDAEVSSVLLRLNPGERPPFHCHPVPTMGYVISGSIEVELASGRKAVFSEGESIVEVMNTVHRGIAVGGPAELVVFYAGAEDLPTTVLPDNDPDGHCTAPEPEPEQSSDGAYDY